MTIVAEPMSIRMTEQNVAQEPYSNFSQNFASSYRDQYTNESAWGLSSELSERYQENIRLLENLTGEKFSIFASEYDLATDVARTLEGQNVNREALGRFFQQEKKIKEYKIRFPQIKTIEELWDDTKKNAQEVKREYEGVTQRASTMGYVGNILGAIAGSFTLRDPLNLGTLGVGGAGRQLLTRVLTEAGANSTIEAINQFGSVQENKELLGLEASTSQALANVAFAGIGAGVIRAAGEGGAVAVNKIREMNNRKFLETARNVIKKPTANDRAAMMAIERDIEFLEDSNPFGKTKEDGIAHKERIKQAEQYLSTRSKKDLDALRKLEVSNNEVNISVQKYMGRAKEIKKQLQQLDDFDYQKPATLKKQIGYIPESLNDFIRKNGGIIDQDGELRVRDINNRTTKAPGKRQLVRTEKERVATQQGVFIIDNSVEAVKQRVFDQGYFPSKDNYDEITNDELYEAIETDAFVRRIYNAKTLEDLSKTDVDAVSKYNALDITLDMSIGDIAKRLYDEDSLQDVDNISGFSRQTLRDEYRQEVAARTYEMDQYLEDVGADKVDLEFENLMNEIDLNREVIVGFEFDDQGDIIPVIEKFGDFLEGMREDEALVAAAKGCAI